VPRPKTHIPPQVGTTYIKLYRGKVHSMKVVLENGRVGYRVAGVTHKTPTGAASPITKTPWSGWQFWGIEPPPPPTRRKGNRWSVTVRMAKSKIPESNFVQESANSSAT